MRTHIHDKGGLLVFDGEMIRDGNSLRAVPENIPYLLWYARYLFVQGVFTQHGRAVLTFGHATHTFGFDGKNIFPLQPIPEIYEHLIGRLLRMDSIMSVFNNELALKRYNSLFNNAKYQAVPRTLGILVQDAALEICGAHDRIGKLVELEEKLLETDAPDTIVQTVLRFLELFESPYAGYTYRLERNVTVRKAARTMLFAVQNVRNLCSGAERAQTACDIIQTGLDALFVALRTDQAAREEYVAVLSAIKPIIDTEVGDD